jgi:hypothetical protein
MNKPLVLQHSTQSSIAAAARVFALGMVYANKKSRCPQAYGCADFVLMQSNSTHSVNFFQNPGWVLKEV